MPEIKLVVSEDLYKDLLDKAKNEGYKNIDDYILHVLSEYIKLSTRESAQKEISRLERNLMDILNKYTSKIDDLSRKVASLHEKIEDLEDKYNDLSSKYNEVMSLVKERIERASVRKPEKIEHVEAPKQEIREKETPPRKTAIEVLKEQKIIYESGIVTRIRDRDSFFRRLESDGAKILKLSDERVAVDPDFWKEFVKKLENIREDSEEAVKRNLSREEYKLFEKLKKEGMVAYSFIDKKWILIEG
ncbi:MAG: hypothetical protein ACP5GI_01450 [Sulfolobales archaeon]